MLPGMLSSREEQIKELERLGESHVRYLLADITNRPNFDERIAEEWLRQQVSARESEAAHARDAREEETLSIAREANKFARNANIWAAIAAIIAAIAIYVAKS